MTSTQDPHTGLVEDFTERSRADCQTETITPLDERPFAPADETVTDHLGQLFDHRIQQVSRLETQRDERIQELLRLREPFDRVVGQLRGKLAETHRLLARAQLDYAAVSEDVREAKRKLFATARGCIQSRVTLAEHEYEVAQWAVTQGELEAHVQRLTQELSQLQRAQKNQLDALKDQASRPRRPRAASDVSQCRQASARLQRRLSGSVKALECWYEPRLVAPLRRRQVGEESLRRSREQAGDLRARLGPLREATRGLEAQRACLEQRLSLMQGEREESAARHKETVEKLKTTRRELDLEFEAQRKAKDILEDCNDSILKELTFLRCSDEPIETTQEDP
ncbi:syncoilin-like isoform 1-T3 [Spinachia spinachia]